MFGITGTAGVSRLPGFVQVADQKVISTKNGSDLTELLRLFGGVNIREYGGGSSLGTISMNATGAGNTLILLNGLRLNSPQNNQFDLSLISKSGISKLEVLSGGSSSIYGSDAVGGVVNIVTKENLSGDKRFSLSGGAGSYGFRNISVNGQMRFGSLVAGVTFDDERSENDYEYFYRNGNALELRNRRNSSYTKENFGFSLNVPVSKESALTLRSGFISADRNLPGIETGSAPSLAKQEDRQFKTHAEFATYASGNIKINAGMVYSNDLMKYNDRLLSNDYFRNLGLSGYIDAAFASGMFRNYVGAEAGKYDIESNATSEGARRTVISIHAGTEVMLSSQMSLFPSARVDHYSDIKQTPVTANFGINYRPAFMEGLFLKARAGNNFTAPSFNDLYWKTGGNNSLKPERAISFSAGTGVEFAGYFNSTFELSFSTVQSIDKIVWLPQSAGYWSPLNLRSTKSEEVVASLRAERNLTASSRMGLLMNATYTNARKTEQDYPGDFTMGKKLPYVPEFALKAGLNIEIENFSAGMFADFLSERYTNADNSSRLPSSTTVEGSVQYTIAYNTFDLTGRLEANNIFNEDYQLISGYPMPLRNFVFRIGINYN